MRFCCILCKDFREADMVANIKAVEIGERDASGVVAWPFSTHVLVGFDVEIGCVG